MNTHNTTTSSSRDGKPPSLSFLLLQQQQWENERRAAQHAVIRSSSNNNNNNNNNNEFEFDFDLDFPTSEASSDISLATMTSMSGSSSTCSSADCSQEEEEHLPMMEMDEDVLMSPSALLGEGNVNLACPAVQQQDYGIHHNDLVEDYDDDDEMSSLTDEGDNDSGTESVYSATKSDNEEDETMMEDEQQHADALSVTVVTTDAGLITLEIGGTVPLQECGHLTIMSRLERSLPVSFVTNLLLLASPQRMIELTLSQVALSGNDREFEDFALALRYLSGLEELHLIDLCLLNDHGTRPLDTILYGISDRPNVTSDSISMQKQGAFLPNLHHIELYAVDIDREPVGDFLSPAALAHLVRNKASLVKLSLEDLTFADEHVVALAQALEDTSTTMTSTCSSTPTSNLKYLKLWGCAVLDQGAVALGHMLEKNTSIEMLDLSYNEIGNVGCVSMANSLHANKSLKALRLVRNESIVQGGEGYEALLEMTKWNHNMVELLLQPSEEVDSDLGFLLFVNRHRGVLDNDNISKHELVDMMHSHQNDTTFLYHFLKAKPALCNSL